MTLEIALPEPGSSMEQNEEWCVVRVGDEWRRVRFHDYAELFSLPGLYERVIYEILHCDSPQIVAELLTDAVIAAGDTMRGLHVLDLGAGNGMVGELLGEHGVGRIVGVDIIEEAARATRRDRPGVYDAYHVVDLTQLSERQHRALAAHRCNCLVCVAALGFGDIPVAAFATAFNLVQPGGWVAFNIKEDFLDGEDTSGFAALTRLMTSRGVLEVCDRRRYRHRLGTDRKPIYYVGMVGRKRRDVVLDGCGTGQARVARSRA